MSFLFPSAPKPQAAAVMPDSQGPAVQEAERRQRLALAARGGRASTILTGGGNGAAPTYSNATLGGAS